ncbi:MAG: hypothetical protein ACU0C9_03950 [Paracoccaceae bacterium]
MLVHMNAVKAGMGMAYLFCFLADTDPDLVRLPKATTDKAITAWALTHPDVMMTERVRDCVRISCLMVQTGTSLSSRSCRFS